MLKDMTKVTASEHKATGRTSAPPTDVFPPCIVASPLSVGLLRGARASISYPLCKTSMGICLLILP